MSLFSPSSPSTLFFKFSTYVMSLNGFYVKSLKYFNPTLSCAFLKYSSESLFFTRSSLSEFCKSDIWGDGKHRKMLNVYLEFSVSTCFECTCMNSLLLFSVSFSYFFLNFLSSSFNLNIPNRRMRNVAISHIVTKQPLQYSIIMNKRFIDSSLTLLSPVLELAVDG